MNVPIFVWTLLKPFLYLLYADFAAGFSNASEFFSMDCALPQSSEKAIWRIVINVLYPFILMASFILFWLVLGALYKTRLRILKRRIIVSVWGVLFVSYFDITTRLIRMVHCIDVDDESVGGPPESTAFDVLWTEDTSVQCWKGNHLALFLGLALPLMLLIPIGLPVWLVSFLWWNHKRFDDLEFLGKYGELYKAYRKKHVYWEAVIMLRKALLALVVVWKSSLGGELQGVLAVCILAVSTFLHLLSKPYSEVLSGLNAYETISLGVSLQIYLSGLIFNSPNTSDTARVILSVLVMTSVFGLLAFLVHQLVYESQHYVDFLLDERSLLERAKDVGTARKVGILGKYYVDKSYEAVGQSVARVSLTAQNVLSAVSIKKPSPRPLSARSMERPVNMPSLGTRSSKAPTVLDVVTEADNSGRRERSERDETRDGND